MYIDDFTFLCPIETGGYSTVWKVKYRGKYYALKMISKERYENKVKQKLLKMEIKIHKQLDHKNIIKLYNSFEDDFFVYILMELGKDDLFNYYTRKEELSDEEILNISQQIIDGLAYLHSKNIIHCDIKMENMLLIDKKIKICDFGLSTQNSYHYSYVGTPECMAPEILNHDMYTNKIDIWSFGIMLYYMVFGKNPFITFYESSKSINIVAAS